MFYRTTMIIGLMLFFFTGISHGESSGTNYTITDGLTDNYVTCIVEDNHGAFWITYSGNEGVSKYDSVSVKTYTVADGLVSNHVQAIIVDHQGVIWLGTNAGVSKFDGTTWKTYTSSDGLIYNNVTCIVEDKQGAIWFGTLQGVSKFDGTAWKTYTHDDGLAGNHVKSITIDNQGAIWFGTWQVGAMVSRVDSTTWNDYTYTGDGLPSNLILSIVVDNQDLDRFGIRDDINGRAAVTRFDGSSWKTFTTEDNPTSENIDSSGIDTCSTLWYDTRTGQYEFDGISWKSYATSENSINNEVTTIAVDSNGTVWLGRQDGIFKLDGQSISVSDSKNTDHDDILSVCPNPFNPSTTITYSMVNDGHVSLSIYNLSGQKVAKLVDSSMQAGTHQAVFDGSHLGSGIYFYQFNSRNVTRSGKVMLVK